MFEAIVKYQFMQNALWACLAASVLCGIIGVIIVEKKLVMMSGGIAHTAYGGVGLGYLCGFPPVLGAYLFAVVSAFLIGGLKKKGGRNADVVIGLLWSAGMALGIFFIALMPGYPPDISSYLFGNILSVTKADLIGGAVVAALVALIFLVFFEGFKAYLFDEEFSFIKGLKTSVIENLLLSMVAVSVVSLIRTAGIVLVLALLTAPAAISGMFFKRLISRIAAAIVLCMVFCFSGLAISFYVKSVASGASIVMVCAVSYMLAALLKKALTAARKA